MGEEKSNTKQQLRHLNVFSSNLSRNLNRTVSATYLRAWFLKPEATLRSDFPLCHQRWPEDDNSQRVHYTGNFRNLTTKREPGATRKIADEPLAAATPSPDEHSSALSAGRRCGLPPPALHRLIESEGVVAFSEGRCYKDSTDGLFVPFPSTAEEDIAKLPNRF